MKIIGVLTSGGDSPGMNAALRSVFKTARNHGIECIAIHRGYQGMIENDMHLMTGLDVKKIIHLGGTIIQTARSQDFMTEKGRSKAYENLLKHKIDGLVIIGGDGSFRGALKLTEECNIPTIGIPGTIDNDIYGTDNTIGYDTALNTVMEAIDKIRDTANSHDRLFFVEVMGRDAGFIALSSGIASAALDIFVPESKDDIPSFIENLKKGAEHGKISNIIVVSEGNKENDIHKLAEITKEHFPHYEIRVSILGHIQRGGSPSCSDRILASRLGVAAVEGLIEGKRSVMAGIKANTVVYTPFEEAIKKRNTLDADLLRVSTILSI